LRNFAGSHRQTFFSWLADIRGSGGTPLRSAAQRAGEFLKNTGVNGPFAAEPGVTTTPQYACRPSYHILMTDGVWNGDSGFNVGNVDNTSIAALPDGTAYTPRAPFRDSVSNTVADVAFKYWAEDAQPNIANELKPYIPYKNANAATEYWDARNNPATWQHLVTYTLGLGLTRSLSNPAWAGSTFEGGYENLAAGTTAWPNAGSDSANNVYDLWHAAVNSRGEFSAWTHLKTWLLRSRPFSVASRIETHRHRLSPWSQPLPAPATRPTMRASPAITGAVS